MDDGHSFPYSLFEHVFYFNIADYIVLSLLLMTRNEESEKTQFLNSKLFKKKHETLHGFFILSNHKTRKSHLR